MSTRNPLFFVYKQKACLLPSDKRRRNRQYTTKSAIGIDNSPYRVYNKNRTKGGYTMSFITLKEYKDSFSAEKAKLKDALKAVADQDPKALDAYQPPVDRRKSVGGIIGAFFIGFAINFVLTLIALGVYGNTSSSFQAMTEAQKETVYIYFFLSMLILPITAVVICLIRNAKAKKALKNYEKITQSQEYQNAQRIQKEYEAEKAACKQSLKEFEDRIDPDNSMGLIYLDGGEPKDGIYMGTLCVDGDENRQILNYRSAPYEFYIPIGSHTVMIKSGDKVVWQEKFTISTKQVLTIDIAGAADSAALSGDLDKYSSSGRTDIRYQPVTRPQYESARKLLPSKPKCYVMQ